MINFVKYNSNNIKIEAKTYNNIYQCFVPKKVEVQMYCFQFFLVCQVGRSGGARENFSKGGGAPKQSCGFFLGGPYIEPSSVRKQGDFFNYRFDQPRGAPENFKGGQFSKFSVFLVF
eukprot:TRINITY_DN10328_c1_g1_i1.p3 TRINITY_DN10328_c1_g1~~TRINITY_DN10328_c1_g1_i1.p3  ORF type:complete len:133 (-),score=7.55 TRINITY_DN10328_c1_g1_i1:427-777(-)